MRLLGFIFELCISTLSTHREKEEHHFTAVCPLAHIISDPTFSVSHKIVSGNRLLPLISNIHNT